MKVLIVGAGIAATLGPRITSRFHSPGLRTAIGILALVLGVWTLVKVIL